MRLSAFNLHSPRQLIQTAARLDSLGYYRFWMTEHHQPDHSSNPLLLAAIVAARTSRLRVGTAGVLLKLMSPFAIAEQAELLCTVFGDRFDIGVASGSVPSPIREWLLDGRGHPDNDEYFKRVSELARLLRDGTCPGVEQPQKAAGGSAQFWLCGLSPESARAAAAAQAGFCFHHSLIVGDRQRRDGPSVVREYCDSWKSTARAPETAVVCFGCCADDHSVARGLWEEAFPGQPPEPAFVGTPTACLEQLTLLRDSYGVGEMAVECFTPQQSQRLRSFELLASCAGTVRTWQPENEVIGHVL
jgi:alkanesulfonate monooxygenase SsuD/methylene tetrahydromethanopterin reductase-like flavin-dependent oxidoreductase (luciferase family)